MRARSLLFGAVLALAASVAVACGGGTSQLRNATEDDLSRLILQTEDAPTNYRRFDEQNSGLGLKRPGEYGSLAQYSAEYELSADRARAGDLACVVSATVLYASADDAQRAVRGVADTVRAKGYEPLDVAQVGDETAAYRASSPGAVFCSGYENEAAQEYYVVFARSNVLGVMALFYRGEGGDISKAVEYAQRQATRTTDTLES